MFFSLYYSRKNYDFESEKKIQAHFSLALAILLIFISIIGLGIGSYLLVNNAAIIAGILGIEKRVISISVIAFGTSIPELATSMIAAFRKEMDISIGNIIGSNIFNLLGILGITSIIGTISYNPVLNIDLLILIGLTILLLFFVYIGKKNILGKWEGAALLFLYFC